MALASVMTISAQTQRENYDAGIEAMRSKDFAKAATLLEAVIAADASDDTALGMVTTAKTYLPQAYYFLGGRAAQAGNYDVARENFLKSAELSELYDDMPSMLKARSWVGRTYEMQGGKAFNAKDYQAAIPTFEAGYAADARNAKMANWLGICYCETGEYDKGMEIFEKVSVIRSNQYADEPKKAEANILLYTNNRVADLQAKKDYNGIIAFADAISAKDPKSALAAKIRLQAYSDKKDYDKVFANADAAAALQTSAEEKSNIYFILGAAYSDREMNDKAIVALKKVTAGANLATAKSKIAELSK